MSSQKNFLNFPGISIIYIIVAKDSPQDFCKNASIQKINAHHNQNKHEI